jgi:UDP-2,3-diacylglucosamine pyrophosphatase LpxH
MHYRSIFISDVHLGTFDCKAELLLDFLKKNTSDHLYLVGDIIDGWRIQQNKWKWHKSHTEVVRKILKISKRSRVTYVAGNHDEFLRSLIPYDLSFGNIVIENQCVHEGLDGKRYLVTHGDLFDGITKLAPWLSFLGDKAYDIVLNINTQFNIIRHRMGLGYWSLSSYLKNRVKKAVDFIFKYEKNLADYCKRKGYDGVICGHIHTPEIKKIEEVIYMNDGDWVESCSALVEHMDGSWQIIRWSQNDGNIRTGSSDTQ